MLAGRLDVGTCSSSACVLTEMLVSCGRSADCTNTNGQPGESPIGMIGGMHA